MGENESLRQMIPIFRRDADEITGAVRMSAAEMVGMEQMPGGRVQIMIRTNSGSQFYITPGLPNLHLGQQALEIYRIRLSGGVIEASPSAPNTVPDLSASSSTSTATVSAGPKPVVAPGPEMLKFALEGPFDEAVLPPLRFHSRRHTRKSRPRIAAFPQAVRGKLRCSPNFLAMSPRKAS